MKKTAVAIALVLGSILSNAAATGDCDRECKKAAIESYFNRLAAVYRDGSSTEDIDKLFELFAPQVTYEHLEYQANFNRSEWKQAFKNNLERGAYSAGQTDAIRVENVIFGRDHVAVAYSYGETTADGEWRPKGDQALFALFGFEGDRIMLVREYW